MATREGRRELFDFKDALNLIEQLGLLVKNLQRVSELHQEQLDILTNRVKQLEATLPRPRLIKKPYDRQ